MARKSRGRQKVAMVRMDKESNRQVTFSKRRSGLFKKASELCTLCGADIAIIVFSPGNKVFSFGHPSIESVVNRFLTGNPPAESSVTMQLIEAHRNASLRELNLQLTQVLGQLEAEKKRGQELTKMRKTSGSQNWWEAPAAEMNMEQLQHLKAAMEELKKNVAKQADKLLVENPNPPPQFFAGSSIGGGGGALPFDPNAAVGFNAPMMPPHAYNPGFGHGFF